MRKILILTSTFLPKPGANGLITYSLAKELIKRNYIVEVISIKEYRNESDYDFLENIPVHRVSKSKYSAQLEKTKDKPLLSRWTILKRRISNLLNLEKFPNFDQVHAEEIYKKAFKVLKNKSFTDVIAVSKPFSNIVALSTIKKAYKEINTHAIFLDPVDSINKPKIMPQIMYEKMVDKALIKINSEIDNIFQPINTREKFEDKGYASAFHYFEYPNLKTIENSYLLRKNDIYTRDKEIVFTFAGTLDSENRNPKVFFDSIGNLNRNSKINLYGNSNIKEINVASESLKIMDKGYVKQNKLVEAYLKSDFLINISNSTIESVPSKIFELFSTGKPIINYVKRSDDYSLKYFEKYPLHFNFFEWKDIEVQTRNLNDFIEKSLNKTVEIEEVERIYYKNTIEYFTNQIEKHISNH